MATPTNETIFSGIKPSGTLHIGNYLGAIKQWISLQEDNTAYFCIVDLHAITVPYQADKLAEYTLDTAAMYLAAGLDPSKSTIFVQSHVPAHTQLSWLLGTTTPVGELNRMTQFKEKSRQQHGSETFGLFAYPVLQAADILLYQTSIVPVGDDQIQHIELTRDIARRFNNKFGEIFTLPKAQTNKSTARIMSLTDPTQKMSKSDPEKSYIALTDEPDTIKKKISGAVTETEPVFSFKNSGPAVKNLLTIYQAFSEKTAEEIEQQFADQGYKEFKEALANLIIEKLEPFQEAYRAHRQPDKLRQVLAQGAEQAAVAANETLQRVKQTMGLT